VVRHTYKSLGFKRLITRICKIYTKHVVLRKCNGACCYRKLVFKKNK